MREDEAVARWAAIHAAEEKVRADAANVVAEYERLHWIDKATIPHAVGSHIMALSTSLAELKKEESK